LAILSALAGARLGETFRLQWVLGPRLRAVAIPNHFIDFKQTSSATRLLSAPFQPPGLIDPEQRAALRAKQSVAGWRATGRVGVTARDTPRARQLLHEILAALRVSETPGLKLEARPLAASAINQQRVPWWWRAVVNEEEIVGLVGWPLSDQAVPGVSRARYSFQPPPPAVARMGRVIADCTFPGGERPLALNLPDALRHLWLIGPTGVGKSTVMGNLCLTDARDGRALVLVDSKGDLVDDVLARLPESRLDDVVVIDPGRSDNVVGLNPLATSHADVPLAVDRLVHVFRQLFGENLGPRSEDILHAGLLTLAYAGDQTLAHLPLLFTQPAYRRLMLGGITDPLGLGSFWQWWEKISEAERRQAVAPLMNKLRAILLRPAIRRTLGQATPGFSLQQVFTERRIVLVDLRQGQLGPESSQLFGALLLNDLWQRAQSRAAIAPERRHAVMLAVDEFQSYLRLPTPFADVLTQARSLGLGLTVGHQHLDQLTPDVRAALIGNVGSRVAFRLNETDANQIARDSQTLTAADFRSLDAYEVYVSLMAKGGRTPYTSARTRPFGPRVRDPELVRASSAARWGRSVADIDAELRAVVTTTGARSDAPIGRRSRAGGSDD